MQQRPVEVAIAVFGSANAVAVALGVHYSRVSRWRKHGHVPAEHQAPLLTAARERKLRLTPHDLVYGREVAETAKA